MSLPFRRRPSLTWRLAVFFAAAAGIALLALGHVIAEAVDRHFHAMDREELGGKLELTRHMLAKADTPAALAALPAFLDDALVGHHHLSLIIASADGRLLFASAASDFPVDAQPVPAPAAAGLRTWVRGEQSWRGLVADLPTGIPGMAPVRVLVAQDIHHHREFMAEFRATHWRAVALTLAVIALLGWAGARRGLLPLRAMAGVATSISARRLDERIAVDTLPVELVGLAEAFNAMLARLEESFQRLSDFSADLAHELRTPIHSLRMQTEVSLARVRTVAEYQELLASNLEEYDRLARMISDMLFLAKAEHGLVVPQRETVPLVELCQQLADFYGVLAEERALTVSGDAVTVAGDRGMLQRAIGNLLANAVRHTPAGGSIAVTVTAADATAQVEVANTGSPIPTAQQARLFERFVRLEEGGEGTGLGLAITRSIVRAHGGQVEVASDAAATRFRVHLPRSA